jgi:hypothetical protein
VSLSFQATGPTKIAPGPYRGRLVSMQKKYKVTENEIGEREDRSYLRWVFAVSEKGYENQSLSVLSSTSFGIGPGGPSKARGFAQAMLGRELREGEQFTADDLYDRPVVLHVDNEKTARGTFARIVGLTPVQNKDEDLGQDELPF